MAYAHVHSSLIMVPMGTHLAYVIFMHHFSQPMRKNPDDDTKYVIFLVKSLLMCGVIGAGA